ncbi:MAG: threonine/serine dehydratase, partial [Gammaproteobacteria bacterium]
IIIEPSSAVVVAALRDGLIDVKGLQVGVILTGGNVDLDHLPW